MAKAKRHTHKYYQVEMGAVKVWACALSDCNHYYPYHMRNMIMGKDTICWQCGAETKIDPENAKLDNPICIQCRTGTNLEVFESEIPLTPAMAKRKRELEEKEMLEKELLKKYVNGER